MSARPEAGPGRLERKVGALVSGGVKRGNVRQGNPGYSIMCIGTSARNTGTRGPQRPSETPPLAVCCNRHSSAGRQNASERPQRVPVRDSMATDLCGRNPYLIRDFNAPWSAVASRLAVLSSMVSWVTFWPVPATNVALAGAFDPLPATAEAVPRMLPLASVRT